MLSGNLFNFKVGNITAGVFAISLCCHAANYYVDYAGGNDNNNGTSQTTAWMHCPEDGQATGTAASTSLQSGDTVIFKGGVSYVFTSGGAAGVPVAGFNVNVSGVTYDGKQIWFGAGEKIVAVDPASGQPVRTIDVAADAGTAFDGKHLYQIAGKMIQKIDPGRCSK